MGFFKVRCGKRGVVSLFVRSAALYCATCRGAAAQRGPKSFSSMSKNVLFNCHDLVSKNVLVVGVSHDAVYPAVAVSCGRA